MAEAAEGPKGYWFCWAPELATSHAASCPHEGTVWAGRAESGSGRKKIIIIKEGGRARRHSVVCRRHGYKNQTCPSWYNSCICSEVVIVPGEFPHSTFMPYFNVTGKLGKVSVKEKNQEKMQFQPADKQQNLMKRSREVKAVSRLKKMKAILGIWPKMLETILASCPAPLTMVSRGA